LSIPIANGPLELAADDTEAWDKLLSAAYPFSVIVAT
jgi:hypothetical protein